ncbi:MAG: cyclodeaminase/cyclohydrolase family protein [Candidatus Contubernalis sp.]|nr:cyclodeaminase/cyclohydrolase family protein [Candidatus Contubernalis sp.]
MTKMVDRTCVDFLNVLSSKAPVPGGGGAAALGGAIGMALSNMVGNLTVGKKKYAGVEDEVKELLAQGYKVLEELIVLVDKDAEVFEPLSKAYGLPTETDEQKKFKADTMEECSKVACTVPMDIMRKSYEGIKIHERMGQIGSNLAISDVGCGVVFLKAALVSGMQNVLINVNSIKDEEYVKNTSEEMNRLLTDGNRVADETLQLVIDKLTK